MSIKQKYSSLKRFQTLQNVDRRFLWQYVARKLKRKILVTHVASVVNILLDEIVNEIISIGSLKIGNFGKFFIKQLSPRRHYDFNKKQIIVSPGHQALRFKLNKNIHAIITNKIDVAKTFKGDKDGEEGT